MYHVSVQGGREGHTLRRGDRPCALLWLAANVGQTFLKRGHIVVYSSTSRAAEHWEVPVLLLQRGCDWYLAQVPLCAGAGSSVRPPPGNRIAGSKGHLAGNSIDLANFPSSV